MSRSASHIKSRFRVIAGGAPSAHGGDGEGRRTDGALPAADAATPEPPIDMADTPAHVAQRGGSASQRQGLSELDDAHLVALAADGDRGAYEVLYRRHARFALHLATRIEGSTRDVEDIVHDAFIKAFERLGDLQDRCAFKSWLGSIVVHAVRSRLRRHRLANLLGIGRGAEPVDLDALASPNASPHAKAQIAQVYALLRTLSADERIAWTLRCVEGHDLETTARLTRCSLATVKRRITRAQQYLDNHFVDVDDSDSEDREDRAPVSARRDGSARAQAQSGGSR